MPTDWERHDPRYVTLQRQTAAVWSVVMAAFWLVIAFVAVSQLDEVKGYSTAIYATWGLLSLTHLAWYQYRPRLLYRHSSFRVDGEGIEIRRGIFKRNIISIPRSRVQHTDVSQGPLERRHGLGTLQIFTAGVMHSVVSLPGVEHGRALAIRDSLLPRDLVVRT